MGLDSIELVLDVEKHFKISIPDEEAARIRSVGELYESIIAKAKNPNPDKIWLELTDIFVKDFGIERKEVKKEAWIVRDLGID